MYRHLCLALLLTLGLLLGQLPRRPGRVFYLHAHRLPGASDTLASGITPSGQIVGVYVDSTGVHGFLYDRGVFTPIDVPGAFDTQAYGISPSGRSWGSTAIARGIMAFSMTGACSRRSMCPAPLPPKPEESPVWSDRGDLLR